MRPTFMAGLICSKNVLTCTVVGSRPALLEANFVAAFLSTALVVWIPSPSVVCAITVMSRNQDTGSKKSVVNEDVTNDKDMVDLEMTN